jgi:hypothetical protein
MTMASGRAARSGSWGRVAEHAGHAVDHHRQEHRQQQRGQDVAQPVHGGAGGDHRQDDEGVAGHGGDGAWVGAVMGVTLARPAPIC